MRYDPGYICYMSKTHLFIYLKCFKTNGRQVKFVNLDVMTGDLSANLNS